MIDTQTLRIVWTRHAIERAMQRFGPDHNIRIPNRIIVKAGRETPVGEDYRIRFGEVVYVCARHCDGTIRVVTVYRRDRERPLGQKAGSDSQTMKVFSDG